MSLNVVDWNAYQNAMWKMSRFKACSHRTPCFPMHSTSLKFFPLLLLFRSWRARLTWPRLGSWTAPTTGGSSPTLSTRWSTPTWRESPVSCRSTLTWSSRLMPPPGPWPCWPSWPSHWPWLHWARLAVWTQSWGFAAVIFTSLGPFHKLTVIYFPSEAIFGPDLYGLRHRVPRVQMENPALKVWQDIRRLPAPAVDPDILDSVHFLL